MCFSVRKSLHLILFKMADCFEKNWNQKPTVISTYSHRCLAGLHDQNKSGFFWRAGFYSANQNNLKDFKKTWLAGKKLALQKSHFCFDHVNRLIIDRYLTFDISTEYELEIYNDKSWAIISHVRNRGGLFGHRLFSSQSELFEKLSKRSDWLEKKRFPKKNHFFLDM